MEISLRYKHPFNNRAYGSNENVLIYREEILVTLSL